MTGVKELTIPRKRYLLNGILAGASLCIFFFSINLISASFNHLGRQTAESILLVTSNPFISLFIGIFITAILQSSSTVTSMTVAAAASGLLGMQNAIPIIMGANIGTSLTSTLVSLAFISKKKQFRKAVAAGVIHDYFNIFLTAILFPLEYYFQALSKLSMAVVHWFNVPESSQGADSFDPFRLSGWASHIVDFINLPALTGVLGLILLFVSLKIISVAIFRLLSSRLGEVLNRQLGSPYRSLLWGLSLTAAVQSSSMTTSLITPAVATGKISLKKAFPFIIGANVGTTVTALLAALFKSQAAVSIAIAHLLFNLAGALLFMPDRRIRNLMVIMARRMGRLAARRRLTGFIYIILIFFLIPFLLIYLSQG